MDDDSDIVMGKSGYRLNWYHRRCKITPRLLDGKRRRDLEYYYRNRNSILYKKRMKYRENNTDSKEYKPTSKLKQAPRVEDE
jgi:hypothetical protein